MVFSRLSISCNSSNYIIPSSALPDSTLTTSPMSPLSSIPPDSNPHFSSAPPLNYKQPAPPSLYVSQVLRSPHSCASPAIHCRIYDTEVPLCACSPTPNNGYSYSSSYGAQIAKKQAVAKAQAAYTNVQIIAKAKRALCRMIVPVLSYSTPTLRLALRMRGEEAWRGKKYE